MGEKRKFRPEISEAQWEKGPLFELLKKDRDVFPAIRSKMKKKSPDVSIDFYYKGGRSFSFDGTTFKTHIRYATEFKDKRYISEDSLKKNRHSVFILCFL